MTSSSRCSDSLYSVAGVRVRIDSTEPLVFPKAFELFRVDARSWDARVTFGIVERLPHLPARVRYESASHWRAYDYLGKLLYEMYYPRSSETYCQMTGNADRSHFSVVFGRQNLLALPQSMGAHLVGRLWFPFPFDQLSVIPTLAVSQRAL